MTATEKAKEMIGKFDLPSDLMLSERVKCALIVIDEIKKHTYMGKANHENDDNSFEYWEQVKNELNKL